MVVKFYRPGRWSDAAILEEHDSRWNSRGRDPGGRARVHDGSTLFDHGGFRYAVYPSGRRPLAGARHQGRRAGGWAASWPASTHRRTRAFRHRPQLDWRVLGQTSRNTCSIPAGSRRTSGPRTRALADAVLDLVEQRFDGRSRCARCACTATAIPATCSGPTRARISWTSTTATGPAVQDLWMLLSGRPEEMAPQLDECWRATGVRGSSSAELTLIEPLRTLRIMHYAAWLARRWEDPAFPRAFPWFGGPVLGAARAGPARADRGDGRSPRCPK